MEYGLLPVIDINHLRIDSDGNGIRSLVVSSECPLRCKYCINDFCHSYPIEELQIFSSDELWQELNRYLIYYKTTGGGVTFGGGEPFLYFDFILNFAKSYSKLISINVETSLNLNLPRLALSIPYIDDYRVDIKDMNPVIYNKYTGKFNTNVIKNLNVLANYPEKVLLRIPRIKGINTSEDVAASIEKLKKLGFYRFECLDYLV